MSVNIERSRKRAYRKRKTLTAFFKKLKRKQPKNIRVVAKAIDQQVWQEINCLDCANCCKTMVPTYTRSDIARIAAHFKMTPKAYFHKWLEVDENGDTVNRQTPCQFLGKDNKCSIYAIRPSDCKGFPHHTIHNFWDQTETFDGNMKRCPATLRFMEKLHEHFAIARKA